LKSDRQGALFYLNVSLLLIDQLSMMQGVFNCLPEFPFFSLPYDEESSHPTFTTLFLVRLWGLSGACTRCEFPPHFTQARMSQSGKGQTLF